MRKSNSLEEQMIKIRAKQAANKSMFSEYLENEEEQKEEYGTDVEK